MYVLAVEGKRQIQSILGCIEVPRLEKKQGWALVLVVLACLVCFRVELLQSWYACACECACVCSVSEHRHAWRCTHVRSFACTYVQMCTHNVHHAQVDLAWMYALREFVCTHAHVPAPHEYVRIRSSFMHAQAFTCACTGHMRAFIRLQHVCGDAPLVRVSCIVQVSLINTKPINTNPTAQLRTPCCSRPTSFPRVLTPPLPHQPPPHSEYVLSWLWSGATSSLTRPLSGGVGHRPLVSHACACSRSRLATPSRNTFAWGTQEASAGPSFAFPASLVNGVPWRSGGDKSASRCCMHTRAHTHTHDVGYLCIDKIASRCCSCTFARL